MSKDLRNMLIAIAIFIALAGGMIYFVTDAQDQIAALTGENDQLQKDIDADKEYCKKTVGLQKTLDDLDTNFRDYVKILPSSEIATSQRMLKIVQEFATDAHVKVDGVRQDESGKGGGGAKIGEFQEVTVSFRIEADFDTFIQFLDRIERYEQFMKVNSFSVTPNPIPRVGEGGKEIIDLAVGIEIATYKYIPTAAKK